MTYRVTADCVCVCFVTAPLESPLRKGEQLELAVRENERSKLIILNVVFIAFILLTVLLMQEKTPS